MNLKVLFSITFALGVAIGDVRLNGKKVLCSQFNRNYLTNVTCKIKLVNRNKQLYSGTVTVKPGVFLNHIMIKMATYYKFRNEYRPTGVKYEEDACAFLKDFNSSRLLISTTRFKNLPADVFKPCPRTGQLKIENMEMVYFNLPSIIPTGEYRFDTELYTNKNGKQIFIFRAQNFFECSEIFESF